MKFTMISTRPTNSYVHMTNVVLFTPGNKMRLVDRITGKQDTSHSNLTFKCVGLESYVHFWPWCTVQVSLIIQSNTVGKNNFNDNNHVQNKNRVHLWSTFFHPIVKQLNTLCIEINFVHFISFSFSSLIQNVYCFTFLILSSFQFRFEHHYIRLAA